MELIKNGDIKEIHAFPIQHADKFKDEFLNSILKDGYPRKDKLNIMLTSKSGIEYFVVDGRRTRISRRRCSICGINHKTMVRTEKRGRWEYVIPLLQQLEEEYHRYSTDKTEASQKQQ